MDMRCFGYLVSEFMLWHFDRLKYPFLMHLTDIFVDRGERDAGKSHVDGFVKMVDIDMTSLLYEIQYRCSLGSDF